MYSVKKRRWCEDNHGEKITKMQQRSTEQRSTVDSRRQNVSQSVNVSSLSNWLSQGSLATHCRWGENLSDVYRKFSYKSTDENNWKSVHVCQVI